MRLWLRVQKNQVLFTCRFQVGYKGGEEKLGAGMVPRDFHRVLDVYGKGGKSPALRINEAVD